MSPNITWSAAADEALCFGWIDSVKKAMDKEKYMQYFSKRKANSTWSKTNKDKVVCLIENRQMTKAGLKCIKIAQSNGSWTILDAVQTLIISMDLEQKLKQFEGVKDGFESFNKSVKKGLL